jgi:Flp pilus assembly protein TadG
MTRLPPALRRFARSEEGGATVEFVLLFPLFFALFLATFEMGMLLARQMMLDRGLDMAVREVRLGTLDPVTQDSLKARICDYATIIPDCLRQVRVEMRSADPRSWTQPGVSADGADCVNRADTAKPVRFFVPGRPNELMMIRVCALFDPYLPSSAIGHRMSAEKGYYELIATSAFVIEPS